MASPKKRLPKRKPALRKGAPTKKRKRPAKGHKDGIEVGLRTLPNVGRQRLSQKSRAARAVMDWRSVKSGDVLASSVGQGYANKDDMANAMRTVRNQIDAWLCDNLSF